MVFLIAVLKNQANIIVAILALACNEKKLLILGIIALTIGSFFSAFIPFGVQLVIDTLVKKNTHILDHIPLLIGIAGLFLGHGLMQSVRYYCFNVAGERAVARIRIRLFNIILYQNIEFFDLNSESDINSRIVFDTNRLHEVLSSNLGLLMESSVQVLLGLLFLLYTSFDLALILLLMVPIIVIGITILDKSIRNSSQEYHVIASQSQMIISEGVAGIRTIKTFGKTKFFLDKFNRILKELLIVAQNKAQRIALINVISNMASSFALIAILSMGLERVSTGAISIGQLVSFIMYSAFVSLGITALVELWSSLLNASGALERINEIFKLEKTFLPSPITATNTAVIGAIDIKNLTFFYPARPDVLVLKNISFSIQAGESIAIVGKSGSGKSTLANLLNGFYAPTNGSIAIDGINITDWDTTLFTKSIGFVEQNPAMFHDTILANITMGSEVPMEQIIAAAQAANAHAFIQTLPQQYTTIIGDKGTLLSGGQCQRIAIARVFLKNPRILVLDEPTSALDSESEHFITDALQQLMQNRTTFVIAHRRETIAHCHRCLIIAQGELVWSGLVNEFFNSHWYHIIG